MIKKGVLFDFDGVVVKSMEQHFDAWQKAFSEKGIHLSPDEFFVLEGQGIETIAGILGKKHGMDDKALSEIMEWKVNYYNKIMTIEFYDNFIDMIKNLKSLKVPTGIVTGGSRSRVEKIVKENLNGYFDILVSVDDVDHGKPFPDPFLKGAELLNLSPEECIVVENAPLGIRGAIRAEMTVIAVKTTLNEVHLKEAHHIAENFLEVGDLIHSYLNHGSVRSF